MSLCPECQTPLNDESVCPSCGFTAAAETTDQTESAAVEQTVSFDARRVGELPDPGDEPKARPKTTKATLVFAVIAFVLLAGLVVQFLLGGSSYGSLAVTASEMGFSTAAEAVDYFTSHVATGDLDGALKAFTAAEKNDRFDLPLLAELSGEVPLYSLSVRFPSQFKDSKTLNDVMALSQAANEIKMFVLGFALPGEDLSQNYTWSGDSADDFIKLFDPGSVRGLKLLRCQIADQEQQESDAFKEYTANAAQIYGYDERVDYLALYELNGETYMGGFTMVSYDGCWSILTMSSLVSDLSYSGVVIPATSEEYEEMLKG